MMHLFPDPTYGLLEKEIEELSDGRTGFTDPFRYAPHPLVRIAARLTLGRIAASEELCGHLSQGKMLGVLVVMDSNGKIGYLSGFSGLAGGRSIIEGFVPPVFDLNDSQGRFRKEEAEISGINEKIRTITTGRMASAQEDIQAMRRQMESEISMLRERKASLRKDDPDFIRLSQFVNAEIKRAKDRWKGIIAKKEEELSEIRRETDVLRNLRAEMSDELQKWIFRQYIVHNAAGESLSIHDIFAGQGLVPPGGTGECAAPKLLEYAYRNGLIPLAMGEFWYGQSPKTAVRTHGHFYPSCTSKCGPLLSFMMKGMKTASTTGLLETDKAAIIYSDDDMIVSDKPSGIPSVPGLDGHRSLQEILSSSYGPCHSVHRLDMDTSGVIIYARNEQAAVNLRRQFEEHTVKKTYKARLSPAGQNRYGNGVKELQPGDKGQIELPLCPDYDERPRQRADDTQGKPSFTEYEVTGMNSDGTTEVIFHPHTGRTHQLRVHSAHVLGLGRPILGDMLYGGCGTAYYSPATQDRLHLHALSISITHPATGEGLTFTSDRNCYI